MTTSAYTVPVSNFHHELGRYLFGLRLGAEWLRMTDLPIKVVATTVAFSSRSHFSRAFWEAQSIDPKSFRNALQRPMQSSTSPP